MKRTLTALLLCTALCTAAFTQNANDFQTDGKGTITGYTGNDTVVVIPSKIGNETITKIEENTFKNKKLTSVTIPNSVTHIWYGAFYGNKLTSVTIPNSVVYIGDLAFYDNELTSITIGESVQFEDVTTFGYTGFEKTYYEGGRQAGTYTRPNEDSKTWTRNDLSAQVSSQSTSGNLSETLKLSGKVHEIIGNLDVESLGITGKIVSGQFNFTIGKPSDNVLENVDDALIRIFWGIGNGIKYSDPTVRAAHLYLYMGNGASIYRATPGFGTSVDYYYVERDLTISRDSAKGVNAFNLSLKKGWNAIITVRENDSTTYSLGNREDLLWEISQDM